MDVSIIIVNYNTKELLRNCISSIYEKTCGIDFEVIVSDNGSIDGSLDMLKQDFPQVILIENTNNIGFGAANNRGAVVAKGKYLFLLNSDTLLLNNAVKEFFDFTERNKNCILGCFLCDTNNQYMNSYGYFTNLRKTSMRFLYDYFPILLEIRKKQIKKKFVHTDCLKVDFVTGADLFISKKSFTELNGFDENIFMYFEDEDLCRRAVKIGLESFVIDTPKIVHLEGKSSRIKISKLKIQEKSCLYYYNKYRDEKKFNLCSFKMLLIFRLFSLQFSCKDKIELTKFSRDLIRELVYK